MDQSDEAFRREVEVAFPSLIGTNYERTSDPNETYNCIAWAAGEDDRWWEPAHPAFGYYWPPGAPEGGDVAALVRAYKAVGFSP